MSIQPTQSSYRRIARDVAIVASLSIGCGIIDFACTCYVYPWWILDLAWRAPVANWLTSQGCGGIAGHWGVIYGRLPEWLLAVILGFCIGGVFGPRWAIAAVPCAAAFYVADHLILFFAGEDVLSAFPLWVRICVYLWEVPSMLLLCFTAFLTSGRQTIGG